jgi:hypothetical protein
MDVRLIVPEQLHGLYPYSVLNEFLQRGSPSGEMKSVKTITLNKTAKQRIQENSGMWHWSVGFQLLFGIQRPTMVYRATNYFVSKET